MSEFNLIDEPWIPCIDLEGRSVEYGIRDTLYSASELREICDDSPLVTASIHRLLLAILYRAFAGPTGFAEWKNLYAKGTLQLPRLERYLDQWHDRFYLFDDGYPFFQMGSFETNKAASVGRLSTELSSGNNPLLFDHTEDDEHLRWSPAKTARELVACQAFALGFGKSSSAIIEGVDEERPYSRDGIALRGLNVWLQGRNLFESLLVNLCPADPSSEPPWELSEPQQYRDMYLAEGSGAKPQGSQVWSARGVVDRFTWQSRLIRLSATGGTISEMYFTQGRSADKTPGDPMKAYRQNKEEGVDAQSLSSRRAAWRDTHAIMAAGPSKSKERRPECFNLVARAKRVGTIDRTRSFLVHVAGLASAASKPGKFVLWRHERMPVPVALMTEPHLIERLGALLNQSENVASNLRSRTWWILRFFRVPDDREVSKAERDDISSLLEKIDPRPAYWARLERHFFDLAETLPNDWDHEADYWKPEQEQTATNRWRQRIKREAKKALEESLKSLGHTSRAIQAVARVRTTFSDSDLQPPAKKLKKNKINAKGGKEDK